MSSSRSRADSPNPGIKKPDDVAAGKVDKGDAESKTRPATSTALLIDLFVTWLAYVVCYLLRKCAPVVKTILGPSVASADCSFLIFYAVGQIICVGWVSNWKPRYVIAFALGASVLCCAAVPAAIDFSTVAFIALWGVLGLCQALIHPTIIRLLSPHLENNPRTGLYMAIWCTSQSVGGALGNLLAGYVLSGHGWKAVFLAPVVPTLLVVAMIVFQEQIAGNGRNVASSATGKSGEEAKKEKVAECAGVPGKTKGFVELLTVPGVPRLAMSFFLVKLVRYVLLLWLPYYHVTALSQGHLEAAGLSTAFEIGGTVGTLLFGSVSDMKAFEHIIGHGGAARTNLCACFLAVGGGLLAVYPEATRLPLTLVGYCIMLVIGVVITGPEAAMSSSMLLDMSGAEVALTPQDLGQLAGIVNGLGVVGATCAGFVAVFGIEFFGVLAAASVLAGIILKFERNKDASSTGMNMNYLASLGVAMALVFLMLGSTYASLGGTSSSGMGQKLPQNEL